MRSAGWRRPWFPASAVALAVLVATGASGAPGGHGELRQKQGDSRCIAVGVSGCAAGVGLDGARVLAVSPDGRNVYAAAFLGDAVAVFDRDPATGALAQKRGLAGCVSETGAGPCADGAGLDGVSTVAVSPDGRNVYAAAEDGADQGASTSNAVTVFDRDPATGALTQKPGASGCISEAGAGGCADGAQLDGARFVTVSPDGANVYVAAQDSHAVVVFGRDGRTGALARVPGRGGCVSETGSDGACADGTGLGRVVALAVSPDGRNVYGAAEHARPGASFDGAVTTFRRGPGGRLSQLEGAAGCVSEAGAEGCADGAGLAGATSLTVSPDGRDVYVASYFSDAVTTFERRRDGGTLTQRGCLADVAAPGCAAIGRLDGVHGLGVSGDGLSLYAAAKYSHTLTVLARSPPSGRIARPAGPAGCVSEDGSAGACADGHAILGAHLPAVSRDGRSVYLTSYDADALAVFDRRALTCAGVGPTIAGTPRRDRIRGTRGRDVIAAGGGNDVVYARSGRDLVCGGGGRDVLRLAAGRDRVIGGSGSDFVDGGPGRDRCGARREDRRRSCER